MLSNDKDAEAAGKRVRRFRSVSRALSLLLLAVAAIRLATGALPLIDPRLSTLQIDPASIFKTDSVMLIDSDAARQRVRATPDGRERLDAHVAQPKVKLLLFLSEMVRAIPFFVMFGGMAMALRALASRGFSETAVSWLRRSALAAVVWTVAQSVATSMKQTALSSITEGDATLVHIVLDGNSLIIGIMVSGAAWIIVWALEEAQAMQRELDEYV